MQECIRQGFGIPGNEARGSSEPKDGGPVAYKVSRTPTLFLAAAQHPSICWMLLFCVSSYSHDWRRRLAIRRDGAEQACTWISRDSHNALQRECTLDVPSQERRMDGKRMDSEKKKGRDRRRSKRSRRRRRGGSRRRRVLRWEEYAP